MLDARDFEDVAVSGESLGRAEVRRLVLGLDPGMLELSRRAFFVEGDPDHPDDGTAGVLGDWWEERGHEAQAALARVGLPITAIELHLRSVTGRPVRFRDVHDAVGH